jgi:hypothetical protein
VPEPIRDQILEQIVMLLKGMTGVRPWGGSYPAAPMVVRAVPQAITQITQYPYLSVVEGPGGTFTMESTAAAGQAMFKHEFKVMITGYVSGDDVTTRSRWLQRLWDDVVRALLANQTLAGVARELMIDPDLETDEGELGVVGAFAQGVTVIADELFTVG